MQVERLLKQTAVQFGITEEELKARAPLKPKLDIDERVARMMDRLNEARVTVRVAGPANRPMRTNGTRMRGGLDLDDDPWPGWF